MFIIVHCKKRISEYKNMEINLQKGQKNDIGLSKITVGYLYAFIP